MKKLTIWVLFIFAMITTVSAQADKMLGKWVMTPLPENSTTISHFTFEQQGNGYKIARTNEPSEYGTAMYAGEKNRMITILDGTMFFVTYNAKTDHLQVFHYESNKQLFELERVK